MVENNTITTAAQNDLSEETQQLINQVKKAYSQFVLSMVSRNMMFLSVHVAALQSIILLYAQYIVNVQTEWILKVMDSDEQTMNRHADSLRSLAEFLTANQHEEKYENSELAMILRISDYRAHVFATKAVCERAEEHCKAILQNANAQKMLYVLTDGGVKTVLEDLLSYLQEKNQYFDALLADTKKSADDLPDDFFPMLNEVCCLSEQLHMLYELQHAPYRKKYLCPHSFDKIASRIEPIYHIAQMANSAGFSDNFLDDQVNDKKDDDLFRLMAAAIYEMREILGNKDNFTGYHIGHIESGKNLYKVIATKISKTRNADGTPSCEVIFGTEFGRKEDAQKEQSEKFSGEEYSGSYIIEFPADEWFTVVRNVDGKKAYPLMMETELDALAELYYLARPQAGIDYLKACEASEKKKENKNGTDRM